MIPRGAERICNTLFKIVYTAAMMPELLHIGLDTLHLTAFAPVLPGILSQLAKSKTLAAQCGWSLGWIRA
jgi:hypothetical protein